MEIELLDNFKGKCLIAMPTLQDDIFSQSVIYITEHNSASGAIGVIINKNLPEKKRQLTANFDFAKYNNQWSNIPFYFGGPVELSSGFILHQAVDDSSALALTGDRNKIHQLATVGEVKPWLLTAGYCLWDGFQLEHEIRNNNWLVLENSVFQLLGHYSPQERYNEALKMVGISTLAMLDFNGAGNA